MSGIPAATARRMLNYAIEINERSAAAMHDKTMPREQWENLLKMNLVASSLIGVMSIVFIADIEVEQLPPTDPAALALAAQ